MVAAGFKVCFQVNFHSSGWRFANFEFLTFLQLSNSFLTNNGSCI